MQARVHYKYFSSLEKTIKIALAFYLTLLVCGIATLSAGVNTVVRIMVDFEDAVLYGGLVFFTTAGFFYLLINRVQWLGELHIWLDRRFFGFLDKSNDIIFQSFLRVLARADRSQVNGLRASEQFSLTQSIFSRLAENFRLFDTLMQSGIFRLWIWYWVLNYGTFTFTLLTIICFSLILAPVSGPIRFLFTICWISALAHLTLNISLGYFLTKMTKRIVDEILTSYEPQISLMLKEAIAR